MGKPASLPAAAEILRLADQRGRLSVRVVPGARSNGIVLPAQGADAPLQVRITQIAEDGKANAALLTLLAKALGVPKSALEIIQGASSRAKVIQLHRRD
jgi:hypothetical protein